MLILVAAIVMLFFILEYKSFGSVFSFLILILIFFSVDLYAEYQSYSQQKIVVYADRKNTHLDLIQGKKHFSFTTDSTVLCRTAGAFWRNLKIHDSEIRSDTISTFNIFNQKRIFLLKDNLLKNKHSSTPFKVDYLILGGKVKIKPEVLFASISPELCIIDQTISPWYRDTISHYCETAKIKYYDIAKQGAFVEEPHVR
jgi:hypothetical protein